MGKRDLTDTTMLHGILPIQTVSILALPEIDRRDFPAVPDDMEMRMLTPASGAAPSIVLFHPETTMHLEIPVTAMNDLGPHVMRLRAAVAGLAMGAAPADGVS